MSADFDRDQLLDIFVAEAGDDMKRFWNALHPEGDAHPEPDAVAEFHAVGHKLKGAALLYGFAGLGRLGALLEETLERVREIPVDRWSVALQLIRDIVASFRSQVEQIGRGGGEDPSVVEDFVRRCSDLLPPGPSDVSDELGESSSVLAEEYLIPDLDDEVLSYFSPEAEEYLNTIQTLAQRLEDDCKDSETIHQLYRVAHTLKGSAYTVGFQVVGDIAHPIEYCMIAVREGRANITADWVPVIRHAVQVIRALMARDVQSMARLQQEVPRIKTLLAGLEEGVIQAPPLIATFDQEQTLPAHEAMSPGQSLADSSMQSMTSTSHSDPLAEDYLIPHLDAEVMSYFAPEAQEYLEHLEADLLRVDKDTADSETVHQLFRIAHTLKGSAYTVGFQSIGDLTHHIEDFMGAVREGHLQFMPGHTDVLLRAIDVIRILMRRDPSALERMRQRFASSLQELKQLGHSQSASDIPSSILPVNAQTEVAEEAVHVESSSKSAEGKTSEEREVIRVSRERLERLLNLVGELVIDRGRLEQRLKTLNILAGQVAANKGRLIDAVRTFEDKHTFSFQPSPTAPGEESAQSLAGISDFGSLEFDKYDDFNILARRISEVTADITESLSQLTGSIHRAQDDMSQLQ